MSVLSVGEALRAADTHVQALTFEASAFHAEGLVAGWGPFLGAAAAVAATLPGQGLREDLDPLVVAWRRWHQRAALARADPRLAAATDALHQVAALTSGRELRGARDLAQVTGHLASIVCIGAHATTTSIRRYLDATLLASQRQSAAQLDATSVIPRAAFTRLVAQVQRAEEVTLLALAQAGRSTPAPGPPLVTERVDVGAVAWARLAQQVLAGPGPCLDDLRAIARTQARVAMEHAHLARVAVEVHALTPVAYLEVVGPLQAASRAWAAAARDWHPAMTAGTTTHSRELVQASAELTQGWASITSPGQQWATGPEIAADHDLGELLEYAAQDHRRASLTARDYTTAARRVLATGQVSVPNKLARAFTGSPAPGPRVPLTTDYADRASFGGGRLTSAAEGARIVLDTAVFHSRAATAARARLPLQMAAPDLDAAIRQRLETINQQRAHRAGQPGRKPAKKARPARGGRGRDDPPPARPTQAPPGPRQH